MEKCPICESSFDDIVCQYCGFCACKNAEQDVNGKKITEEHFVALVKNHKLQYK